MELFAEVGFIGLNSTLKLNERNFKQCLLIYAPFILFSVQRCVKTTFHFHSHFDQLISSKIFYFNIANFIKFDVIRTPGRIILRLNRRNVVVSHLL